MDHQDNPLFTPLQLGDITLANRIAMAPMTRNRAPDNIANAMMAEYYRQRSGAGLIITEGAQISPRAVGYPATPGIHSDAQVDGWQGVTSAIHEAGSHAFIQLWHCGRVSHPDFHDGALPVAPSAIKPAGDAFTATGLQPFVTPHALDAAEIAAIVEDYRQAALRADAAGFDGVEIHAANGYLIDQFIRDGSNSREDGYGGKLANRVRLLLEVVEAVGRSIGFGRVGVRISPINGFNDMRDSDPQATFDYVAASLSELKPGYLHAVEVDMSGKAGGYDREATRRNFDGLYIANGGYTGESATAALQSGHADLVAFGIPFLANPDLPERLRRGAPLNEADVATFYGGDSHGYTDYPALEHP